MSQANLMFKQNVSLTDRVIAYFHRFSGVKAIMVRPAGPVAYFSIHGEVSEAEKKLARSRWGKEKEKKIILYFSPLTSVETAKRLGYYQIYWRADG